MMKLMKMKLMMLGGPLSGNNDLHNLERRMSCRCPLRGCGRKFWTSLATEPGQTLKRYYKGGYHGASARGEI